MSQSENVTSIPLRRFLVGLTLYRLFATVLFTGSIWFTIWFEHWVSANMGPEYALAYVWVSALCSAAAVIAFFANVNRGTFRKPNGPRVPLEYVSYRILGDDDYFVTLRRGEHEFTVKGFISGFKRTDGVAMCPEDQAEADSYGNACYKAERKKRLG